MLLVVQKDGCFPYLSWSEIVSILAVGCKIGPLLPDKSLIVGIAVL